MTGSCISSRKGSARFSAVSLSLFQCAGCAERKPPHRGRSPGAGGTGSPKGCQHLPRVGGDGRRICQCANPTAGQWVPDQAGLSKGSRFVHTDDVLFEIDPRPFQAVLDQAKAQLAQAEAQLGNATLNVDRDIPEAEANAIARSQLEGDMQAQSAAQATVAAAHAAVEQAALNLSFTKVRSLISGIAGIAQVQVGNLVTPSAVGLPRHAYPRSIPSEDITFQSAGRTT